MPGSARQWATTPVDSDMDGSQGQTLTSESVLQMRRLIRTKITEVGFVPPSPPFVPHPRPLSPVPLGTVTLQASTASSQTWLPEHSGPPLLDAWGQLPTDDELS